MELVTVRPLFVGLTGIADADISNIHLCLNKTEIHLKTFIFKTMDHLCTHAFNRLAAVLHGVTPCSAYTDYTLITLPAQKENPLSSLLCVSTHVLQIKINPNL